MISIAVTPAAGASASIRRLQAAKADEWARIYFDERRANEASVGFFLDAAEFFLVRDRQVISSAATIIRVEKTGIERWLYNLSRNQPLIYGLMSVGLALLAGWLANAAFRFGRR